MCGHLSDPKQELNQEDVQTKLTHIQNDAEVAKV